MSDFQTAVAVLLSDEGGTLNPDDNGRGPSKWGITLATAQGFGLPWSVDDIADLTPDSAAAFYQEFYWEKGHISLLSDQAVATKMLDLIVNVGPIGVKWLQSACDVCEDMLLGPQTAGAANGMNPDAVLAGVRARGEHYYRALAAKNPERYGKDLAGWLARLAK